jgi:hypothetical protein
MVLILGYFESQAFNSKHRRDSHEDYFCLGEDSRDAWRPSSLRPLVATFVIEARVATLIVETRVATLVMETRVATLVMETRVATLVLDKRVTTLVMETRVVTLASWAGSDASFGERCIGIRAVNPSVVSLTYIKRRTRVDPSPILHKLFNTPVFFFESSCSKISMASQISAPKDSRSSAAGEASTAAAATAPTVTGTLYPKGESPLSLFLSGI